MISIFTTLSFFCPKQQHKTFLELIEISLKSNAILKYSDNSSQYGIIYTFNIHVFYFIMQTIYENTEQKHG